VPEDVSIVGFDDHEFAAHQRLTTLQVPAVEMGQRAANYLVAKLRGESPPDFSEVEVRLVVRGTAGPVKRAVTRSKGHRAR
jgi:LacI family transcriptional regulator